MQRLAAHGCLARFLADERGATAIEYALLAALVGILAIGSLQALSSGTGGLYERWTRSRSPSRRPWQAEGGPGRPAAGPPDQIDRGRSASPCAVDGPRVCARQGDDPPDGRSSHCFRHDAAVRIEPSSQLADTLRTVAQREPVPAGQSKDIQPRLADLDSQHRSIPFPALSGVSIRPTVRARTGLRRHRGWCP